MLITYTTAENDNDLLGILQLQAANLAESITEEELRSQGFVTVIHDLPLLRRMNTPLAHVIAKDGNAVIGYCLVMQPGLRTEIPVLMPMFDQFDALAIDGIPMNSLPYCVMGQVCIAKSYRGQGIFAGLYKTMAQHLRQSFEYLVTEVSLHNPRSLRAHEKVGFTILHQYQSEDGEQWAIIILRL